MKQPVECRVDRQKFLRRCEDVQPGLSTREIIEQSSCLVFKDGFVHTFNEEVACQRKSGLPKKIEGAVQARPFLDLLRLLPDTEIVVACDGSQLSLKGSKNRRSDFPISPVLLPVDDIDRPEEWRTINPSMSEAIGIVVECTAKDDTTWAFVHFHPKWVEACDNFQMARWRMKTGIQNSLLIRRDAIKHVGNLDLTKIGETENFLHFKTASGLVMSCKKWIEDYEDLGPVFKTTGTPATLPKRLGEACQRGNVFSSQNSDSNFVTLKLTPNKLVVTAVGEQGQHREPISLKYSGPKMTFIVSPKLMAEVTKKYRHCQISDDHRLRIDGDGGKFVYVVCLERPTPKVKKVAKPEEEGDDE